MTNSLSATNPRFVTCGVCDGHGTITRIDWNSSETLPQPVKRDCWMCGGAGKHVHPDDLNPEPEPTDEAPLERPADIQVIGLGDTVRYAGEYVSYVGQVIDVDYETGRCLVRVDDNYSFWAGVERLDLAPEMATASTEVEAA